MTTTPIFPKEYNSCNICIDQLHKTNTRLLLTYTHIHIHINIYIQINIYIARTRKPSLSPRGILEKISRKSG